MICLLSAMNEQEVDEVPQFGVMCLHRIDLAPDQADNSIRKVIYNLIGIDDGLRGLNPAV